MYENINKEQVLSPITKTNLISKNRKHCFKHSLKQCFHVVYRPHNTDVIIQTSAGLQKNIKGLKRLTENYPDSK